MMVSQCMERVKSGKKRSAKNWPKGQFFFADSLNCGAIAMFVCLLLCIRKGGGIIGNTDKTLCWSAVCTASEEMGACAQIGMGTGYAGGNGREDVTWVFQCFSVSVCGESSLVVC
jgi:hypothetical protein